MKIFFNSGLSYFTKIVFNRICVIIHYPTVKYWNVRFTLKIKIFPSYGGNYYISDELASTLFLISAFYTVSPELVMPGLTLPVFQVIIQ